MELLRRPFSEDWVSLTERPGYLRVTLGANYNAINTWSEYDSSRLDSLQVEVETALKFERENFQQMAGLIFYYDTEDYVYLRVTHDENINKCLGIIETKHGKYNNY